MNLSLLCPQESLADQAYGQLEAMIVTQALAPGAALSEAVLSSRTSIGRTPIREALKRLECQGLVTSLPRKGLVVRPLKVEDQLTLLEVLRPLSRLIAGKAARWASEPVRGALRACAQNMAEAGADLDGFLKLHQEGADLLYSAARNPFAQDLVAPLHSHCRRFWYSFCRDNDLVRLAELHAGLLGAAAEGQIERAMEASDTLIEFLDAFTRTMLGLA